MINQLELLSDYILRPREERTAHIDLGSSCRHSRRSPSGTYNRPAKDDILKYLGIEDDIGAWQKAGICRSHLCPSDSHNGWCRNPQHYYLATWSENVKTDAPGGVGCTAGKARYKNPETGETAVLTREEAEEGDWVGANKGKTTFRDPESGEYHLLTREEAAERGLVGLMAGVGVYRNPENGECLVLSKEDAAERGWVGVVSGTAVYRDPESGVCTRVDHETAKKEGLVSPFAGTAPYRDPKTGDTARLTPTEAVERGWVSVNQGRKQRPQKRGQCPHCGKEGFAGPLKRYHFDNCPERSY